MTCLVAVDLKIGAFKPEYAGKMNYYLSLLDRLERGADENRSIGIILCAEKDRVEVELALEDMGKPIGVADYQLIVPKEKLQKVLADEIKAFSEEKTTKKYYNMDIQRINQHTSAFNDITHYIESDNGKEKVEVWFARELQSVLGYSRWENFTVAIGRAVESCKSQNINVDDHFREVTKMISLAKGAKREVKDYMLTRFACYLIAQNGDPKKEEIAFAQGYFALQTRRAELIAEHLQQVSRLETRDRLRASEKQLSRNIYERGVDDCGFGRIRSKGDTALFGGHTTEDMKHRLGIKSTRPLADFLPTLTIAAKNLATEMTNYNVEQKDLYGEPSITAEHVQNNVSVRQMLGQRGIKPENLPPAEDIKKVERRVTSNEKKIEKTSNKLPKKVE